jgi:hypothetical protein
MVNKYMRKCSASLAVREMQMRGTHHVTSFTVVFIMKKQTTKLASTGSGGPHIPLVEM